MSWLREAKDGLTAKAGGPRRKQPGELMQES